MKGPRSQILILFCLLGIIGPTFIPALAASTLSLTNDSNTEQSQFTQIIVNGKPLTGPNSSASRRDGRILVPTASIARGLGDTIQVDKDLRTISVTHHSGTRIVFDARMGQIRENGSPILSISNAGEIVFTPNPDELLLPIEIAAALFNAAIRFDSDKNVITITRGLTQTEPAQSKIGRSIAEIHQIDYDLNLSRYASNSFQNLTLSAAGRFLNGRFALSSNSGRSSTTGISIRNTSISLDRPNGQRFVAGDFGAGSDLQFLSANIRGGSARIPVGTANVTAYTGRSFSGTIPPANDLGPRNKFGFAYDTEIFGVFAASNPVLIRQRNASFNYAAGAMHFNGANRRGDLAAGSLNYAIPRFRIQADLGFGKFNGRSFDDYLSNGNAAAVDVSGTFELNSDLAFQARFTKIGQNFLNPQVGIREPIEIKAAGMTWSPLKWLSTSFNASAAKRAGTSTQNNQFVSGAFAITPGSGRPRIYVSHTQNRTNLIRSAAFTMVNASKEFQNMRIFMNATRVKNTGPAAMNFQLGTNYRLNDNNSLEISQGIGSGRMFNGQLDWRTTNLLNSLLTLGAGAGYNYSQNSKFSAYERLSASINLPRQTSLQINYYNSNSGPTVFVSLKGSLFKKRDAHAFLDSLPSEMNDYGKISGRVYQDVDQNGRFDPEVDKPQPNVKIRVDGNRYVVSDENGLYRFESIAAGDHKLYIDLLSVRADLTLLGETAEQTKLKAGYSSVFDFRLVRTGRISGRVWLDTNLNGKFDEDEVPLADIRVVTASGRDTLTDADGYYVIGDLAPGEHVFLLDEKTLPEKTMSGFKPIAVHSFAGRETSDINLAVIAIPAEIKRFSAKPM